MTFLGIQWGAACYLNALGGMFLVPLTVEEAGVRREFRRKEEQKGSVCI